MKIERKGALTLPSIWTAKFTVSEFLKRLTERFWRRGYEIVLRGIRIFLAVTFFIVVIATLSECQPFPHFWQVSPDPGPQCRQGYAHLLSMGTTDIVTDVLLVVFPIPIILRSAMSLKRKFDLVALFSMSIVLIGITAARIPSVIERGGRQQYRTVFASGEILAATAVSNAVILGSFLRDRGVKKTKRYKYGSTTDSMDRSASRRPTVATQQWGSDEDLIRGVGIRVAPELESPLMPRPAPVALPASPVDQKLIDPNWQFPSNRRSSTNRENESDRKAPFSPEPYPSPQASPLPHPSSRRNVSFFDVGGLLETGPESSKTARSMSTSDVQDFATSRRGSRALLSDLGGLLSPSRTVGSQASLRRPSRNQLKEEDGIELSTRDPPRSGSGAGPVPPIGVIGPMLSRQETLQSLQDVGGLLGERQTVPRLHPPPRARGSSTTSTTSPVSPGTPKPRRSTASRGSGGKGNDGPALQDVGGLLKD